MPAKNSVKIYVKNGVYHIYNRGVDKRDIFMDTNDYRHFTRLLQKLLREPQTEEDSVRIPKYRCKNFSQEIDLLAFCLMPNHFHLLIRQSNEQAMANFIRCLAGRYVTYFNNRHKREGTLFQGRYKASIIFDSYQALHVSRYIHLNPKNLEQDPFTYEFSSLKNYLGRRRSAFLNTSYLTGFMSQQSKGLSIAPAAYRKFMAETADYTN